MPLRAFSFPFPETRFFKAGLFIYKFKIKAGSSYSGKEAREENCYNQELEDIVRTVLYYLDDLQPFCSTHFNVFPLYLFKLRLPDKKPWEGVSKVMCKHNEKKLKVYPFILILYLEKINIKNAKPAEDKLNPGSEVEPCPGAVVQPLCKCCKRDSSLEEAIIKNLINDMECEPEMVESLVYNPKREVKMDPGTEYKGVFMKSDDPREEPGISGENGGGSPPGLKEEVEEEKQHEDGGDDDEDVVEAPKKRKLLSQIAGHIFPFSMFFRDT